MKRLFGIVARGLASLLGIVLVVSAGVSAQTPVVEPPAITPDLVLTGASVTHYADLGVLLFEQRVEGLAGGTVPEAIGGVDGAPVLAYAFPTTLAPESVGFHDVEGILALVVTSHPDFDDTPLWDENLDGNPENDGVTYHTHWVVLGHDDRVPGGLSVIHTHDNGEAKLLPPTAPGMPMYLDSPGFSVQLAGDLLRVVVPVDRVSHHTSFNFDAVTCYLQVNTSDDSRPMLGIYAVYSVLSGDLTLPFTVIDGEIG